MLPHRFRPPVRNLALMFLAGLIARPALGAEQDVAPVDIGQLLQALRTMRTEQVEQTKTRKKAVLQQITAAAGSNERAVALWAEGIRVTEMLGGGKEGAQYKAWREGEGDAFKEREVQNAVRLHLQWLALTLQRSTGTPVKELLPAVVSYTQELQLDQAAIDALVASIQHDKELAKTSKTRAQRVRDDAAAKKAHDSVLKQSVASSPVAQWLKLGDWVAVDGWEQTPGNLDGIFKSIILPELRAQKDPRVLEYWDMKLQKEAEQASKLKLSFEIDKFNTQRRPTLLWNRASEFVILGQKNRAITEMFGIIKTYPAHPDAVIWISKLETLLLPPALTPPDAAPTETAPAPPPATSAVSTTAVPGVPPAR